jgi:hypothetical protein
MTLLRTVSSPISGCAVNSASGRFGVFKGRHDGQVFRSMASTLLNERG